MNPAGRRRLWNFRVSAWTAALLAATVPATLGAAEPDAKTRMDLGRKIFTQIAQPQCGICHALEDAGTSGTIGAKLEELKPDEERVVQAVRQGSGVMPPYKDKLTDEQIRALAYYVSQAVRNAK